MHNNVEDVFGPGRTLEPTELVAKNYKKPNPEP